MVVLEAIEAETDDELLLMVERMTVVVHVPREIEINERTAIEIQKDIRPIVEMRLIKRVSLIEIGTKLRIVRHQVHAGIEGVFKTDKPPIGI